MGSGAEVVEDAVVETAVARFNYGRTGTGPSVLLLPGGGGWRLTFESLARHLSSRFTIYALDPPGQGGTRVLDPDFGYRTDAIAASIEAFLDALGLQEVAIVGHSWGGGFAARFTELHPDRVSRLALLAPGGLDVGDVWEFQLLRLPVVGELATRLTTAAAVGHMMRKASVHRDRIPRHLLVRAARELRRGGPDGAVARRQMLRVERTVTWADTERDLHRIDCPVLIIWGEHDRFFPVGLLQRYARHLPHAETHTIADAGHAVHDDQPDVTYPLLAGFLLPAGATNGSETPT